MSNLISTEKANKIYDVLVKFGDANELYRDDFIYHHCTNVYGCTEYPFGNRNFSGKYRSLNNFVTIYDEDKTQRNLKRVNQINAELKKLDENNNMQMSTMQSDKEANP